MQKGVKGNKKGNDDVRVIHTDIVNGVVKGHNNYEK